MFKKLLALGAAGITAAVTALPAMAEFGLDKGAGLGLGGGLGGLGCGLGGLGGGLGCGFPLGGWWPLAGWWGPIVGCPWGLFGGPFFW